MERSKRTFKGKTVTLDVLTSDTVSSIKQKIQKTEGIPIDRQRIIFDGEQLEDNRTLADYNISEDTVTDLIYMKDID